MGSGVLIIVVGMAVGALMIAAPKGIWWVTQSWQFRNPEANEPSDAAYGVTRLGGVAIIVIALGLGGSIIADHVGRQAEERAQREKQAAEEAFVAPPPEKRGDLPVVGYFAEEVPAGIAVSLYYLAPADSFTALGRGVAKSFSTIEISYPCYSTPIETHGADGRITFNAQYSWAPEHLSDLDRSDSCRMGRTHKIERVGIGPMPTLPPIVTDMPIANLDGTELKPAAPDNAVPRLAEEPEINPGGSRTTVSSRGRIPIIGYEYNGADDPVSRWLALSFLTPEDADFHMGDDNRPGGGGCEVVPIITRAGAETVTIDLQLFWSDRNDTYNDEDDRRCRVGTSWSYPVNTNITEIAGAPTILTNGPVVTRGGTVVRPAAPGNRVPALP